jgi:hypothetical protein
MFHSFFNIELKSKRSIPFTFEKLFNVKQNIKICGKVDFVDRMTSKDNFVEASKELIISTNPEDDNKDKTFRLTASDGRNAVKTTSGSI